MSNQLEHAAINVHLAKIETKLDLVLEEHDRRLEKLETAQGKQNLVAASIGAIGAGIVMALKFVVTTKT